MPLEKKVFFGLNLDDADRDLPQADYRFAKNLVAVSDGVTGGVRRENMIGMLKQASPVSENAICLGAYEYIEDQKAYFFFYDIVGSERKDSIYEYDIVARTWVRVMVNPVLDFDIRYPIHDAFVIEDLLYFNDGINEMRKVNISQGKAGLYDGISDSKLINVIKPKPQDTILWAINTSGQSAGVKPNLRFTPLQFTARWVYNDDEVSVLGPSSEMKPYIDYYQSDGFYDRVKLDIKFPYDDLKDVVKRIELVVREGNTAPWYKFDELDVSLFAGNIVVEGDTTTVGQYFYYFLGNRAGAILPESQLQPFESVPRLTDSISFMESRIFAPSTLEEYDVAEDDWEGVISISEVAVEGSLNNNIYFPSYYKDNSRYIWGVVFEAPEGRQSAAVVQNGMEIKIPEQEPVAYAASAVPSNAGVQAHPKMLTASITLTGKPPVWATKYKIVRSNNLSFSSTFLTKWPIKFLYRTEKYSSKEDTGIDFDTTTLKIYYEDGYIYRDVEKMISDNDDLNVFGRDIHLVIPAGIPISLDESSILKIAYAWPVRTGLSRKTEYNIEQIDGAKAFLKGMTWVDWNAYFKNDAVIHSGVGLATGGTPAQTLYNDELFVYMEILNPLKEVDIDSVLLYEIGDSYDVKNAGTSLRAFQDTHNNVDGDCYQTGLQVLEEESKLDKTDGVTLHRTGAFPISRNARWKNTVSYASFSPISETDRREEWLPARQNDQGFPTVTVEEQSEKRRGFQIRYSNKYIADSFVNGLSNWPEENKYVISADRGDIKKLAKTNEKVLLAIHKRSMTSLYINERIVKTGSNASILSTTVDVVGDDRKLLLDIGTTHPESVVVNNNRVYGFDSIYGEPWRRSLDGITPLASGTNKNIFKMKTFFEEISSLIRRVQRIDPQALIKIYGGYDLFMDMYVLSFAGFQYTDEQGVVQTVDPVTLGFSEKIKRWVSFFDFDPEYYVSINNNLASFKDSSLWIHQEGEDRNKFYDQSYSSSITFSLIDSNDTPKLLEHIGIASNKKWTMEATTPEGQKTRLSLNNFVARDNMFYASILRNENTPADTLLPDQTPLLHGDLMIGSTMEVTLTNNDTDVVQLDAVYVGFNQATGHLLAAR